jgi:hypothetical protein
MFGGAAGNEMSAVTGSEKWAFKLGERLLHRLMGASHWQATWSGVCCGKKR